MFSTIWIYFTIVVFTKILDFAIELSLDVNKSIYYLRMVINTTDGQQFVEYEGEIQYSVLFDFGFYFCGKSHPWFDLCLSFTISLQIEFYAVRCILT